MYENEEGNSSAISMVHYQTLPPQTPVPAADVDDLRYRISQLEHLVVTSALHNTTISSSTNPNTSRLTNHGLIERVSQLESLLAASELDNQRLNRQVELLHAAQLELKVDSLEKLREKNYIVSDLEQNIELLQVKLTKTEKRLESVGEYVNTLPSQEELDEAKDSICRYEAENHLLQDKVDRMLVQLHDTQTELIKNETLYNNASIKLDELKHLEEAQESVLNDNLQVTAEIDLLELVTVQKAQILRSRKIIKSLKTKLCDGETERAELQLQIAEKKTVINSIQENLMTSRMQIETLEKQLSHSDEKRKEFEKKCQALEKRCDENEKLFKLRAQEMGNLIRLVTEIDLSVQEMTKLIEFAQNVCSGEEPPMDSVLGFTEIDIDEQIEESMKACRPRRSSPEDKSASQNSCDSDDEIDSEFDIDVEWILERLKKVRDLRKDMNDVSSRVSDLYSDMLSGTVGGCAVQ